MLEKNMILTANHLSYTIFAKKCSKNGVSKQPKLDQYWVTQLGWAFGWGTCLMHQQKAYMQEA